MNDWKFLTISSSCPSSFEGISWFYLELKKRKVYPISKIEIGAVSFFLIIIVHDNL